MQDLTLVGMHDDGERLLLRTADGDRFTLAVDDALRAAVRGDRPRLGQLQLETERMRPRDVQARIRAGQTAEEVAAAGDVPLDYVRRYEGPVLAERAYVASQARRVQIRRGALAAATTPTLGDLVEERLRRREVDPEQSVWDSWRGDDGTWTVQLDFPVGEKRRQARWNYNPPLRQVTPLDDESRWLTDGDGRDREARPARRRDDVGVAVADGGRRLTVAPGPSNDDDDRPDDRTSDAGQDLLDALVEQESSPSLELLDTLRERRGRRIRPIPDEEADGTDPVESAIESILALRNNAQTTEGGNSPAPAPATPVAPAARRQAPDAPSMTPTGRRATRVPGAPNGRAGSNHPAGRALARDAERAGSSPGTSPGSSSPDGRATASSTATPPGPAGSSRSTGTSSKTGTTGTRTTGTGTTGTGTTGTGTTGTGTTGTGTGRRAARVPEPGGSESSTGGPTRSPQRRTQRTIEVPPVQGDPSAHDPEAQVEEPVGARTTRAATPGRAATTRKNRRASVPSWDEIILGARRD